MRPPILFLGSGPVNIDDVFKNPQSVLPGIYGAGEKAIRISDGSECLARLVVVCTVAIVYVSHETRYGVQTTNSRVRSWVSPSCKIDERRAFRFAGLLFFLFSSMLSSAPKYREVVRLYTLSSLAGERAFIFA